MVKEVGAKIVLEDLAKETFSYLFKSMKTLELERRKILHSILGDFIENKKSVRNSFESI